MMHMPKFTPGSMAMTSYPGYRSTSLSAITFLRVRVHGLATFSGSRFIVIFIGHLLSKLQCSFILSQRLLKWLKLTVLTRYGILKKVFLQVAHALAFHLDSPAPLCQSQSETIEHGRCAGMHTQAGDDVVIELAELSLASEPELFNLPSRKETKCRTLIVFQNFLCPDHDADCCHVLQGFPSCGGVSTPADDLVGVIDDERSRLLFLETQRP